MGDDLDDGFDFDGEQPTITADLEEDEDYDRSKSHDRDFNDDFVSSKRSEPDSPGDSGSTSSKKKKQKKSPKPASSMSNSALIISTGRSIVPAGLPAHQAFFNACYLSSLTTADSEPPEKLALSAFISSPAQATKTMNDGIIDFLRTTILSASSGGAKRLKKHRSASPLCIIVSSSAKRSCEVLKLLGPLKTRVGKLFSKNMKYEEQVSSLASQNYPLAVGTPNRLRKLLEEGALSLESTELLLLDCKPDPKGFNVVTLKDTQADLMALVRDFVTPMSQSCRIALF